MTLSIDGGAANENASY
jgi:Sperm tail C-terminal domain